MTEEKTIDDLKRYCEEMIAEGVFTREVATAAVALAHAFRTAGARLPVVGPSGEPGGVVLTWVSGQNCFDLEITADLEIEGGHTGPEAEPIDLEFGQLRIYPPLEPMGGDR